MGQGPGHILAGGLPDLLREDGHQLEVVRVEDRSPFPTEIASAFGTADALARQVRMAMRQRRIPLVLAGNCFSAVGVVSGLPRGSRGVVWLDAHGDLHTPDTTRSGFLDGMALATALGLCWANRAAAIPGFRPLQSEAVLLAGTRDLEVEESALAAQLGVACLGVEEASDLERFGVRLDELAQRVDRIHLHLDVDVLDPDQVAPANAFTPPAGLSPRQLFRIAGTIRDSGRLSSISVASYDPSRDPTGAVREVATMAVRRLLEPVGGGG